MNDPQLFLVIGGAVLAVLVVACVVWVFVARSQLMRADAAAERAWGTLVETIAARGTVGEQLIAASSNAEAQESAKQALAAVAAARGPRATAEAEGQVSAALRVLGGDAETQAQLATAEDTMQSARRNYNHAVRERQRKAKSFPGSMFAGSLPSREFFEVDAAGSVAAPPRIQF